MEKVSKPQTKGKAVKKMTKIMITLLLTIFILALLYAAYYYYKNFYLKKSKMITILDKAKQGKTPLVISQDPDNENHIKIKKSKNQKGGIEFTYSFWIIISSLEKKGEWKHLFHKGNKSSFPNRAPGVWLHPHSNDLRIYLNTKDDPLTFVDIEGIPLKKWVNITFVFTQNPLIYEKRDALDKLNMTNVLDVFVNGMLKKQNHLIKNQF